jgi:hypothetical protein
LGPLGTAATNRPIVPAPGDYDDGEIGGMIVRRNRSIRRKPAPVPLCSQTPHAVLIFYLLTFLITSFSILLFFENMTPFTTSVQSYELYALSLHLF